MKKIIEDKIIFVCGHRPKTKELHELLLLFFSIGLISSLKGNLREKNSPKPILKDFKNHATDLAPVLSLVVLWHN